MGSYFTLSIDISFPLIDCDDFFFETLKFIRLQAKIIGIIPHKSGTDFIILQEIYNQIDVFINIIRWEVGRKYFS